MLPALLTLQCPKSKTPYRLQALHFSPPGPGGFEVVSVTTRMNIGFSCDLGKSHPKLPKVTKSHLLQKADEGQIEIGQFIAFGALRADSQGAGAYSQTMKPVA